MEDGQFGVGGAAVRMAFAREISAFEQELVPTQYQAEVELFVLVKTRSRWIV